MSKYLQKFRTDWSMSVSKQLGIKQNEAEAIFDKYCQDSELEIYNSVNFQTTKMFATDFYYISQINFILQENGVLFWKHSKKESVIGKEIVNKMAIRQEFKRKKNHYTDIGDKIQASIYK